MPHWKLTLAYDGTSFHGWQVQPHLPTIQGALAAALLDITGETVLPQGSGRTDAGVHALAQVASVTLQSPIPSPNLHRALNRTLPASIRILSAEQVPATFHARLSARQKTYEYRIFERHPHDLLCSPFLAPYVWDCRFPLNLTTMQQAALDLLGTHDFTSFAASDPDLTQRIGDTTPNPLKTIHAATLHRTPETLTFRITGSGFLHHMVRNIVGTLVEIGRGAYPPDCIPKILSARDRKAAGPTAPAPGLFLVSVDYDPPESLSNPPQIPSDSPKPGAPGPSHLGTRAATEPEGHPCLEGDGPQPVHPFIPKNKAASAPEGQ